MNKQVICPNCNSSIELDELMAAPFVEQIRLDYDSRIVKLTEGINKREVELKARSEQVETEKAELDAKVLKAVAEERKAISKAEEAKAKEAFRVELAALNEELAAKGLELKQAQDNELALRKRELELQAQAERLELDVQRKLAVERATLREEAKKQADDEHRLKLAEKDTLIERLKAQAEEMKRKAEVGSQQLQGEVAELDLEERLAAAFPSDEVSEVKKGVRGADTLQRVNARLGAPSGAILWERKNAQAWGGDWIAKAKEDQRAKKAEAVVIVSDVLPKGIQHFDCVDDVWVATSACAMQVAKALRQCLIETASARRTEEGRKTNAERVYDYLMGPEFVLRVKGIAEPFVQMQEDLEAERRGMTKHWARRQKLIDRALEGIYGVQGDLQGLAGADMPELPELQALPSTLEERVDII